MKSSVLKWKFGLMLCTALFIFAGTCLFAKAQDGADGDLLITADLLLPKSTCAYVSIRDIEVLRESWQETSLGKLQAAPEMEEFFKSLQNQLSENLSTFQNRLGVTLDDIGEIAASEIAASLIQIGTDRYGVAVIINVGDKQYETQSVLTKIADRVKANGGKHQKQEVENAEIHFLNILNSKTGKFHKAYYILKENFLIASDKAEVVKDILNRHAVLKVDPNKALAAFADVDSYLEILNKSIIDDVLPDVIWYCDPIRLMQVQRVIRTELDPEYAETRDTAELLCKIGVDGIEAVGGVYTFRHRGYDSTQRFVVSIPNEPQKALKMLAFDETADQEIPDWVTSTVGGVWVVNLDFLTLFDNLGSLINQLFGDGEDTVWEDVLDGFENDPYGPQLNLRNEIFALCENKMLFITENLDPTALDGERCAIAVPLKDAEKMKENLNSLLSEEPTFETLENGDDIRWKLVDEDHEEGTAGTEVKNKRFPELTITVWNGYLLVASEPDYIDHLQNAADKNLSPLTDTAEFKLAKEEAEKLSKGQKYVSFHYVNAQRVREHTYEMIKRGTLMESAATYSSVVGEFLAANTKKENGEQFTIDASKLPEYDAVKKYFHSSFGFLFKEGFSLIYQEATLSDEKTAGLTE